MDVEIQPTAKNDMDEFPAQVQDRVMKKILDIQDKTRQGIPPDKAVEKRLGGGWHPLLQQRVGDYRVWFVEGARTEKGDDDLLYVVRILDKETQQKMRGLDISPDTYL